MITYNQDYCFRTFKAPGGSFTSERVCHICRLLAYTHPITSDSFTICVPLILDLSINLSILLGLLIHFQKPGNEFNELTGINNPLPLLKKF